VAPAATPTTTAAIAGGTLPMSATATTTSSEQNSPPATPKDGRNGSVASAITSGPATATIHATRLRTGDRCLEEALIKPPSTLTD
jgi:hypothetical protein